MYRQSPKRQISPHRTFSSSNACKYETEDACTTHPDCIWHINGCRRKRIPSLETGYTDNVLIENYPNNYREILSLISSKNIPEDVLIDFLQFLPTESTPFMDELYSVISRIKNYGFIIGSSGNVYFIGEYLRSHQDPIDLFIGLLMNRYTDIFMDIFPHIPKKIKQKGAALLNIAAEYDLDLVKYLIGVGINNVGEALIVAAATGKLNIVEYITSLKTNILLKTKLNGNVYGAATVLAAQNGHYSVVKYLIEEGRANFRFNDNEALLLASLGGHLEIVKYLTAKGSYNDEALAYAVDKGHTQVVEYLISIGMKDIDSEAMKLAAGSGYFSIVKLLIPISNLDCLNDGVVFAAMSGHLEIVEYLIKKGGSLVSEEAIEAAEEGGYPEIARYLEQYI